MRCYVEWMKYLEVKQFKRGKEDIYQCPVCSRHNLKKNIAIRCLKAVAAQLESLEKLNMEVEAE